MAEFKPVVFKLGQQEYGVDISVVQGIENVLPVVPLSNVSPCIKGIINLRGEILPVYSLRKKFGMDNITYTADSKFIIAKADGIKLALEIDAIGEIQNIDDSQVHGVPKIITTDTTMYYERIVSVDNRLIVMINVEELLNDIEKENLSKAIKDL